MCEENAKEGLLKSRFQISFDEATHTYIVNGKVLPSVTQIMRDMSENHYAGIPKDVLDKAAERGTRVHRAVEMYEKYGIETDDDEIIPYLLAYRVAKKVEGFEIDASEIKMTNGEFCGTIDLLGRMNKRTVMIDLKATSVINQPLLEMQLAGYDILAADNDIYPSGFYVLQLKPNGTYKFKMITPDIPGWCVLLKKWHDAHPDQTA